MDAKLRGALDRFGIAMCQANDVLGQLTCSEFQSIAELLVMAGLHKQARIAIRGHAQGDDDPDDHHHELFDVISSLTLESQQRQARILELVGRHLAEIEADPADDSEERELRHALDAARRAADGDSNDAEIDALQIALSMALRRWPQQTL